MMKQSTTLLFIMLLLAIGASSLSAQTDFTLEQDGQASKVATPRDMFEFGITPSYLWVSGDVTSRPGYGIGVHLRKALDYMFSLRLDGNYGIAEGDQQKVAGNNRRFDMTWLATTGFAVMSLNNFRFDRVNRRVNYYIMAGAGANFFESEYLNETTRQPLTIEREFSPHAAAGGGLVFRLGKRVNLGIEYQAQIPFGRRADLLDGSEDENGVRTPFRDVVHQAGLAINFNIGNKANRTEPLYWVNAGNAIVADMDDVRRKQEEMTADIDRDGVLDIVDQELNTPANVPVDTRGRTLDSDRDGIADFRDKDPYRVLLPGERVDEDGVIVNPSNSRSGVTEERVREIVGEELARRGLTEGNSNLANWFLPMIHFQLNRSTIKYSDYGTLASIGKMLQSNPDLRIVVEGHTDNVGDESYNKSLSYDRAKAVIDHLVTNFGIGRGRLVLQWKGEEEDIIDRQSSYINRRVEFRTAQPSDVEMDPPSGQSGY